MRGNVHVRFGGRKRGNGTGATRSPRPLPTRHLPIDRQGANLFFQLVSRRYERGSIIITTNIAFKDWPRIFAGDANLTSAPLDRLLHHAQPVLIEGDSYRSAKRK